MFPYLSFFGWFDNSMFSSVAYVHVARQAGFHWYSHDIVVGLPSTLVDELRAFLAHRRYTMDEYALLVAKCQRLISELALTAPQLRDAALYAPALAWYRHWQDAQQVSRVVTYSFLGTGSWRMSIDRSLESIIRSIVFARSNKTIIVFSVIAAAVSTWLAVRTGKRFVSLMRFNYPSSAFTPSFWMGSAGIRRYESTKLHR
jgi:hypothetical protein